MAALLDGRVRWLVPAERLLHATGGVDPARGQGWRGYTLAMLAANAAGFVLFYALLRLQGPLPFNPAGVSRMLPLARLQHRGELRHQHQLADVLR